MRIVRLAAVLAIALAALPIGIAAAQYPQPLGACTVTPNAGSVQPNTVATFTVTTTTAGGAPAPAVAGTARLTSGAGTVQTPNFVTDNAGKATVSVLAGANPGNLQIGVTCGALSASGVVQVVSGSVLPKPPDTGAGIQTTAEDSTLPLLWIAGAVLLLGAAGSTAAVAVRRSR